jgi:hypothetical protein
MATAAQTFYTYGTMAGEIDRPVVNQTDLNGTFDFALEYKPSNNNGFPATSIRAPDAPPGSPAPSGEFGGAPFVEALHKQLGLKLVRTKALVRTLVIDHVERPSENWCSCQPEVLHEFELDRGICLASELRVVTFRSWRSAWEALTRAAGLDDLRFHDLRHQAISEMAEAGVPEQTILDIAGHVDRKMLDHYSHIRLEARRSAVSVLGVK